MFTLFSTPDYPTFWEGLFIVAAWPFALLLIVGLPAGSIGYIIFRVTEWRRKARLKASDLRRRA